MTCAARHARLLTAQNGLGICSSQAFTQLVKSLEDSMEGLQEKA